MPGKRQFKTDHPDPVVRSLEQARQKTGFSQQQMAKALGVPFRTYQKWVYTDQKPRHPAALLARAQAMCAPRRANCWEVIRCGREPGGRFTERDGVCPAAADTSADGVNSGENGGRVCWAISGTLCEMDVQANAGSKKLASCLNCDFFYQVLEEEGSASFKLLKPGQSYTQS